MPIADYRADLHEIRKGLYLGSARAESAPLQRLQNGYGITHIVQVGTNDFMSPTHSGSLVYCCIQALDFEGEDLLTKLKEAHVHQYLDEALSSGGKVLVHCFAGVSRSATTVISYLMAKEGLSFEKALADVISKRSCVAPNRGFCHQLRILQDHCGGNLEKYTSKMLQEEGEELTMKQWLAILMRAKDKELSTDNAQLKGLASSLSTMKVRLEERKKLGREGKYEGIAPPKEEPGGEDQPVTAAGKSSAEEYGLALT